MSFVRICVSLPAAVVACAIASVSLGGCYDLSTSGPRPDDFRGQSDTTEPEQQDQDQTETPPADPTALDRGSNVIQAVAAQTPDATR